MDDDYRSIDASTLKSLIADGKLVLEHNNLGSYIVPAIGLYPHQVLWDSCFIAIGLSNYNQEQAKLEINRLLDAQWSNGMIPHIVFTEGLGYWWDRRIWRSWISPLSNKQLPSSGISQPPMLAEAIVRIGKKLSNDEQMEWYRSVFPRLVAYHWWFYQERDPQNDGLIVQLHPWETGLDNSPPCMEILRERNLPWWLKLLEISHLDNIGNFFRTDYRYVQAGQRSSNVEALSLYGLLLKIRRQKYNSAAILTNPAFMIQDITYNSIFVRANRLLMEIAETINQKLPKELIDKINQTAKSFEKFWDNDSSQYYSGDPRTGQLIKEPSVGTLLPLYSGVISQDRAAKLVKMIKDSNLFGLKYPLPTVPANSDRFHSKQYWQGPSWININWLIIDGLKRYDFYNEAQDLTVSSLKLIKQSGFYEYFDPNLGTASGVANFSWTAALTIDLAYSFIAKDSK